MTTRTKKQNAAAAQLAGHDGFSLISNEKLIEIYATMVKCRLLEEQARKSLTNGRRTKSLGHEAAAVAVTIDLLAEDTIAPSPHDYLLNFIKGAPLSDVVGAMRVRTAEPDALAAQLEIAGNAALCNKTKRNGKVVLAFLGDLPASVDFLDEAFNFAGVHQLPVLFVCRSGAATRPAKPKKAAESETVASKAKAHGIPCIAVDGNDAVAVYRVATESIAHARRGNGPTLIECLTLSNHAPAKTTPAKRKGATNAAGPIENMERYLTGKGLFSNEIKLKATGDFASELGAALARNQ